MDNPKVIVTASILGVFGAALLMPLGITFIVALALSVALMPWVLLSPAVGPFAIFNKGNRSSVYSMLSGNSNIPMQKVRTVALSVMLASVSYAILIQLVAEVILRRFLGMGTLDHSMWWYFGAGVTFFVAWKVLEHFAGRA